MRDAEYFKSRIGGLDGAGDTGDYLINLVRQKSVPVPKSPLSLPPAAATETNGNASGASAGAPESKPDGEMAADTDPEAKEDGGKA